MSKLTNASDLLVKMTKELDRTQLTLKSIKKKGNIQIETTVYDDNGKYIGDLDVKKMIDYADANAATSGAMTALIINMLEISIEEMERDINELTVKYLDIVNGVGDGD
jgi:prefoldin subunit 5